MGVLDEKQSMLNKPDNRLIEGFFQNTCTLEEAKGILKWLSAPEGIQYLSDRFDIDRAAIEHGTEFLPDHDIRSSYIFEEIAKQIKAEQAAKRIPLFDRTWTKIAAVVVALLSIGSVLWYTLGWPQKETVWQEVYVPRGEKLQVLFQDGTRVWLNSDTRLKYPLEFKGNKREVKLEGEAYFVVHKNARKPFFVHTNSLSVKVTGTSFDVKAYKDENTVTTTLDEGKVSLIGESSQEEATLLPGQRALYSNTNKQLTISKTSDVIYSNWKTYKITFKDTPMSEVVKTLERWYNVKINIADPAILKYTYTIEFNNENIKNVLSDLQKITPIQCTFRKNIIDIGRKRH
jgi:ferric-dicitrate binding protein FerR (iron transport regulator)